MSMAKLEMFSSRTKNPSADYIDVDKQSIWSVLKTYNSDHIAREKV